MGARAGAGRLNAHAFHRLWRARRTHIPYLDTLLAEIERQRRPFLKALLCANVARRLRKPTEEFIFVLSGRLLIGLGEKDHILNPGDSIYFEGYDLQMLACASEDEDVFWISVITPPVF